MPTSLYKKTKFKSETGFKAEIENLAILYWAKFIMSKIGLSGHLFISLLKTI